MINQGMKCYRIRKKPELLTDDDRDWMARCNEADFFIGPVYETLKGAKAARNNRAGYMARNKDKTEIVEYSMVLVGVINDK